MAFTFQGFKGFCQIVNTKVELKNIIQTSSIACLIALNKEQGKEQKNEERIKLFLRGSASYFGKIIAQVSAAYDELVAACSNLSPAELQVATKDFLDTIKSCDKSKITNLYSQYHTLVISEIREQNITNVESTEKWFVPETAPHTTLTAVGNAAATATEAQTDEKFRPNAAADVKSLPATHTPVQSASELTLLQKMHVEGLAVLHSVITNDQIRTTPQGMAIVTKITRQVQDFIKCFVTNPERGMRQGPLVLQDFVKFLADNAPFANWLKSITGLKTFIGFLMIKLSNPNVQVEKQDFETVHDSIKEAIRLAVVEEVPSVDPDNIKHEAIDKMLQQRNASRVIQFENPVQRADAKKGATDDKAMPVDKQEHAQITALTSLVCLYELSHLRDLTHAAEGQVVAVLREQVDNFLKAFTNKEFQNCVTCLGKIVAHLSKYQEWFKPYCPEKSFAAFVITYFANLGPLNAYIEQLNAALAAEKEAGQSPIEFIKHHAIEMSKSTTADQKGSTANTSRYITHGFKIQEEHGNAALIHGTTGLHNPQSAVWGDAIMEAHVNEFELDPFGLDMVQTVAQKTVNAMRSWYNERVVDFYQRHQLIDNHPSWLGSSRTDRPLNERFDQILETIHRIVSYDRKELIKERKMMLLAPTKEQEAKTHSAFVVRVLAFAIANRIIFPSEINGVMGEATLMIFRINSAEDRMQAEALERDTNPNFGRLLHAFNLLSNINRQVLNQAVAYFIQHKNDANVLSVLEYFIAHPDLEVDRVYHLGPYREERQKQQIAEGTTVAAPAAAPILGAQFPASSVDVKAGDSREQVSVLASVASAASSQSVSSSGNAAATRTETLAYLSDTLGFFNQATSEIIADFADEATQVIDSNNTMRP